MSDYMADHDREDAFRALGRVRDTQIADLFTLIVGIAAEKNPTELRTALAQVFDLSAIESSHDRMMLVLTKAHETIDSLTARVRELERQVNQLESLRVYQP